MRNKDTHPDPLTVPETSRQGSARDLAQGSEVSSGPAVDADKHRFGSPPEPVVNPSAAWCDAYADWYYQGRG